MGAQQLPLSGSPTLGRNGVKVRGLASLFAALTPAPKTLPQPGNLIPNPTPSGECPVLRSPTEDTGIAQPTGVRMQMQTLLGSGEKLRSYFYWRPFCRVPISPLIPFSFYTEELPKSILPHANRYHLFFATGSEVQIPFLPGDVASGHSPCLASLGTSTLTARTL